MVRFGGGPDTPEEHAHFGTIDVLTGFCACVGLGAALLKRKRDGSGEVARASLAAAGNLIQARFMYDTANRAPFDEPSGREAIGWGPFYHCYECADQWMFLAAPTDRGAALARVPELADLAHVPEEDLVGALAERVRAKPFAYWAARLNAGSSAAVPLGSLHDTRDASLQRESGGEIDITRDTFRAVRHDRHPMGRWVDLVAPNAVRPEDATIRIPGPAPKYGSDTVAILKDLGKTDAEIEALVARGVVATRWSDKYLPE